MTTLEGLNCAGGEPVLDFSSIDRIDAATARALEELADRSSVRITLRGVNVGVYRALNSGSSRIGFPSSPKKIALEPQK